MEYWDFDAAFLSKIRLEKSMLSTQDKKFLLREISKSKEKKITNTLKAIKLYAVWEPQEAILEARKKGVFRYRAYGFERNTALLIIEDLLLNCELLSISGEEMEYLVTKQKLAWIYDFYRETESKLIKYILKHHKERQIIKRNNTICENSLFKDLLAYIDLRFYLRRPDPLKYRDNKNKLDGYSNEVIAEASSYIIFLYDRCIGIKQDFHYFIDAKYVQSQEIEDILLMACKMIELEEWELSIDYFGYGVRVSGTSYTIYSPEPTFEQSVRVGFIHNTMQEVIANRSFEENEKEYLPIAKIANDIVKRLGETITQEVNDGVLSRYRFQIPEPLFDIINRGTGFYKEEAMIINHVARELMLTPDQLLEKKVTEHCSLSDVVRFQRFFVVMDQIIPEILLRKKNRMKAISSLVPSFTHVTLIITLINFLKDRNKAIELLDLFTYEKSNKLDLQYTPLIRASEHLVFSNSVVARSNLIRNVIAYSHMANNQIVNDDNGLEPLVAICSKIFDKAGYKVLTNKKYKYKEQKGEIDVVVANEKDVIFIECKSPLPPVNNFEMRASLDHVHKASKQLDLSTSAFSNREFKKMMFKQWGISDNDQAIKTCIVFGNRLLSGYKYSNHPIRYIYELDMVLNQGKVSLTRAGIWSIWQNKEFCHDDLLNYLSDKSFVHLKFSSMRKAHIQMFIKGKKVMFETYVLNQLKVLESFDNNLRVISKDKEYPKYAELVKLMEKELP